MGGEKDQPPTTTISASPSETSRNKKWSLAAGQSTPKVIGKHDDDAVTAAVAAAAAYS